MSFETQAMLRTPLRPFGVHSTYGNRSAEAVSLWGINGRAKAAAPNFPYSDAMIAAGGVWDEASLSAFLADPSGYLPDGVMPYEGIADAAIRAEVVAFLKRLK